MNDEMPCPRCKIELRTVTPNGALSCSRCGGGFCSRSTLAALLRQVEIAPPADRDVRPSSSAGGPARYVTCPVCSELMLRRNFGESSGVVVDVCSQHGVWFDRGELGTILEFGVRVYKDNAHSVDHFGKIHCRKKECRHIQRNGYIAFDH